MLIHALTPRGNKLFATLDHDQVRVLLLDENFKLFGTVYQDFGDKKIKNCCFSPDGSILAVAVASNIFLYDLTNFSENNLSDFPHSHTLTHEFDIHAIAFEPSLSGIVAAGDSVVLWKRRPFFEGDELPWMKTWRTELPSCGNSIVFSDDGRFFALRTYGSRAPTVWFRNENGGHSFTTLAHPYPVLDVWWRPWQYLPRVGGFEAVGSCAGLPFRTSLLTLSSDGTLRLWSESSAHEEVSFLPICVVDSFSVPPIPSQEYRPSASVSWIIPERRAGLSGKLMELEDGVGHGMVRLSKAVAHNSGTSKYSNNVVKQHDIGDDVFWVCVVTNHHNPTWRVWRIEGMSQEPRAMPKIQLVGQHESSIQSCEIPGCPIEMLAFCDHPRYPAELSGLHVVGLYADGSLQSLRLNAREATQDSSVNMFKLTCTNKAAFHSSVITNIACSDSETGIPTISEGLDSPVDSVLSTCDASGNLMFWSMTSQSEKRYFCGIQLHTLLSDALEEYRLLSGISDLIPHIQLGPTHDAGLKWLSSFTSATQNVALFRPSLSHFVIFAARSDGIHCIEAPPCVSRPRPHEVCSCGITQHPSITILPHSKLEGACHPHYLFMVVRRPHQPDLHLNFGDNESRVPHFCVLFALTSDSRLNVWSVGVMRDDGAKMRIISRLILSHMIVHDKLQCVDLVSKSIDLEENPCLLAIGCANGMVQLIDVTMRGNFDVIDDSMDALDGDIGGLVVHSFRAHDVSEGGVIDIKSARVGLLATVSQRNISIWESKHGADFHLCHTVMLDSLPSPIFGTPEADEDSLVEAEKYQSHQFATKNKKKSDEKRVVEKSLVKSEHPSWDASLAWLRLDDGQYVLASAAFNGKIGNVLCFASTLSHTFHPKGDPSLWALVRSERWEIDALKDSMLLRTTWTSSGTLVVSCGRRLRCWTQWFNTESGLTGLISRSSNLHTVLPDHHPLMLYCHMMMGRMELISDILKSVKDYLSKDKDEDDSDRAETPSLGSAVEPPSAPIVPTVPLSTLISKLLEQTQQSTQLLEPDDAEEEIPLSDTVGVPQLREASNQPSDKYDALFENDEPENDDAEVTEGWESLSLLQFSSDENKFFTAILHTVERVEEVQKRGLLDSFGLKFFSRQVLRSQLQKRGKQDSVDSADFCWAMHSETQQNLMEQCFPSAFKWEDVKRLGVPFWLKSTSQLRVVAETAAENQYSVSLNPDACCLLYVALQKKATLIKLYKKTDNQTVAIFLGNDFKETRWRTAAHKNAFALLGKQRFEMAVAFFLLGNGFSDAIRVCLSHLHDPMMALLIVRLVCPDTKPAFSLMKSVQTVEEYDGPTFDDVLNDHMLPMALKSGNLWFVSSILWRLGRTEDAVEAFVPFLRPKTSVNESDAKLSLKDTLRTIHAPEFNFDARTLLQFMRSKLRPSTKTKESLKKKEDLLYALQDSIVARQSIAVLIETGCSVLAIPELETLHRSRIMMGEAGIVDRDQIGDDETFPVRDLDLGEDAVDGNFEVGSNPSDISEQSMDGSEGDWLTGYTGGGMTSFSQPGNVSNAIDFDAIDSDGEDDWIPQASHSNVVLEPSTEVDEEEEDLDLGAKEKSIGARITELIQKAPSSIEQSSVLRFSLCLSVLTQRLTCLNVSDSSWTHTRKRLSEEIEQLSNACGVSCEGMRVSLMRFAYSRGDILTQYLLLPEMSWVSKDDIEVTQDINAAMISLIHFYLFFVCWSVHSTKGMCMILNCPSVQRDDITSLIADLTWGGLLKQIQALHDEVEQVTASDSQEEKEAEEAVPHEYLGLLLDCVATVQFGAVLEDFIYRSVPPAALRHRSISPHDFDEKESGTFTFGSLGVLQMIQRWSADVCKKMARLPSSPFQNGFQDVDTEKQGQLIPNFLHNPFTASDDGQLWEYLIKKDVVMRTLVKIIFPDFDLSKSTSVQRGGLGVSVLGVPVLVHEEKEMIRSMCMLCLHSSNSSRTEASTVAVVAGLRGVRESKAITTETRSRLLEIGGHSLKLNHERSLSNTHITRGVEDAMNSPVKPSLHLTIDPPDSEAVLSQNETQMRESIDNESGDVDMAEGGFGDLSSAAGLPFFSTIPDRLSIDSASSMEPSEDGSKYDDRRSEDVFAERKSHLLEVESPSNDRRASPMSQRFKEGLGGMINGMENQANQWKSALSRFGQSDEQTDVAKSEENFSSESYIAQYGTMGSSPVDFSRLSALSIDPHPSEPLYATASSNGVHLFRAGQPMSIAYLPTQRGSTINKVRWSHSGRALCGTSPDGVLSVWRNTGMPEVESRVGDIDRRAWINQVWRADVRTATDAIFLNSDNLIAMSCRGAPSSKNVLFWDTKLPRSKALVSALTCHPEGAFCLAFMPHRSLLFAGGKLGAVTVFDVATQTLLKTIETTHKGSIRALAADPNEKFIVTGSSDGCMKVIDVSSFSVIETWKGAHPRRRLLDTSQSSLVKTYGVTDVQIFKNNLYSCGADGRVLSREISWPWPWN